MSAPSEGDGPAPASEGPSEGAGERESARPPWSEFKRALDRAGFRPSKRLGQNFLLDDNMARSIARDAEVEAGDFVLEVGPGCGFLSVHLALLGARLLAVEIDERLADVAESFLQPFPETRILRGDALAGKHRLWPELEQALPREEPWSLVSNLPYSISAPLLVLLARHGNPPRRMTVLVQKEVGERLAAGPGTSAWGPLSARLQLDYGVELVRTVSAKLFWPRPKVESAVVRMDRRTDRPAGAGRAAFDHLVTAIFQRRRKTLGAALGAELKSRETALGLLAAADLDPGRRGETLSVSELEALAAQAAWGAAVADL